MRRLLIADIHANLPAFEAVLKDAGKVDEIVFLGDVVGYGPHPSECIDLLRDISARAILGNHDAEILSDPAFGPPKSDSAHAIWRHWTYLNLTSEQRDYLACLPETITIESCGQRVKVIHTPTKRYLHPDMPDELLSEEFRDVHGDVVYFGHSHRLIDRVVDGRRFVCFRPVGQPREGCPRAFYAIEQDHMLEHRSVDYDIERTVRDLGKIGLPRTFLARWIRFLRTGFDREWSRDHVETSRKS